MIFVTSLYKKKTRFVAYLLYLHNQSQTHLQPTYTNTTVLFMISMFPVGKLRPWQGKELAHHYTAMQ